MAKLINVNIPIMRESNYHAPSIHKIVPIVIIPHEHLEKGFNCNEPSIPYPLFLSPNSEPKNKKKGGKITLSVSAI